MKILVSNITRATGIAIATSLARHSVTVIGIDDRALLFNSRSRYVKRQYVVPGFKEKGYLEQVFAVLKKEKPDFALFSNPSLTLIAARREIEKYTSVLMPSSEAYKAAYDNNQTLEECVSLGIPCPQLYTKEQAREILKKNDGSKLILKPRMDIGAAQGQYCVSDVEAFYKAITKIEQQYNECVIEEYIPGTRGMRTVNLLFDKNNQLAAYFMIRKILELPITGGLTAMGQSIDDRKLLEMVMPFFLKWKWEGFAEAEIKIDERDGIPKLIEINPRVWGYIGFPIRSGVDFPWIASKLAMQNEKSRFSFPEYQLGLKYINHSYYAKAFMAEMAVSKHKFLSFTRLLNDLQGKKVNNNIEKRDWLVICAKMLTELIDSFRKKPKNILRR